MFLCIYVVNKKIMGEALLIKNNDCVNKMEELFFVTP
jgi:hypothetical protein